MIPLTFIKSPSATLDYQIDWSIHFPGDTITSSCWVVPSGVTQVSTASATLSTTIYLSGGTACSVYTVTNKIGTSASRIEVQSLNIRITDT